MLVTPANGIMFLASFAFLAIGIVSWLSFPRPDASARLWMSGFVVSGVAPILGALGGAEVGAGPFISSSVALAVSFVLFGLAMQALQRPSVPLRDYWMPICIAALVYALCLGYAVDRNSDVAQIVLFAAGNTLAAAWATRQAMQLNQHKPSRFVVHLIVVFGIQAVFLFIRIPQSVFGEPSRLWQHDTLNEIIVAVVCLCGIIKAVSYYALRFEEIREQLEQETGLIREQSQQLAQKNVEIISALHAVPIACVVTSPALDILHANTQAKRLRGDSNIDGEREKLCEWMLGLRAANLPSFASSRYMALVTQSQETATLVEVSARGLESNSAAAQYVFIIKPVEFSDSIMDSVWFGVPTQENRTYLFCDDSGIVKSAQASWFDQLGAHAVFESPQFGFEDGAANRNVKGLNLWSSLRKLTGDIEKIDRASRDLRSRRVSSLLLRSDSGLHVSCGFIALPNAADDSSLWIVEVVTKQVQMSTNVSKRPPKNVSIDNAKNRPLDTEVPAFLRQN